MVEKQKENLVMDQMVHKQKKTINLKAKQNYINIKKQNFMVTK